MPIRTPPTFIAVRPISLNSDSVRKPCAIVPLKGDSRAARSGSVCIHCRSSVASANALILSCETSIHSLTAPSRPTGSPSRLTLSISITGGSFVLLQLHPRDCFRVDLVGAVCESQRPRVGPHRGEREVPGDARAAVRLHGAVEDGERDVRRDDLN